MFKVTDKGFNLIGVKNTDVVSSLESKLYKLNVQNGFFGVSYDLEEVTRYKTAREPRGGVFMNAYSYITRFFDPVYKATRNELGMVNKMNVIFNGLPGTGKTHMACMLAEKIIKQNNALGIFMSSIEDVPDFPSLIDKLRINDADDRMIIFVFDEMEKNNHKYLKNPKFLSFLDGADSRENVMIIATSNKISDLPDYLINRPGRFEKKWDFKLSDKKTLRETVAGAVPEDLMEDNAFIDKVTNRAHNANSVTFDDMRFHLLDELFKYRSPGNKLTGKETEPEDPTPTASKKVLEEEPVVEEKLGSKVEAEADSSIEKMIEQLESLAKDKGYKVSVS